jgi:sensor c-di-GMP phosphodiesterase-like protein
VTDVTDLETIRAALDAHEFFLVYQPIVDLQSRQCAGAEALIRWQRGEKTVIDACGFIPQTDQTPLSGPITYWVIDTIASDLGDWLPQHPEALIGINVPPEILGRGGLEYAAKKSGLRAYAKQLILEITERGVPDQLGLEALNSVASTGARVALDDTLLSGANLALLTRCRFDFVKIDHSLVSQIGHGEPQPTWLDGLAALLGATPLQVIAEGVETEAQAQILAAAGVRLAQGHYLSPPLRVGEFKRFYAK